MENTTQKVNVKEIMDRANKKTESVKESTEKIQSKVDNFKIVPGFTKFEFNGNILRNCKTKNIIKFKTGRTKYQIFDDNEVSHNLSNDDIRKLMPSESKKEEKVIKEPKLKKEKVLKEKKIKEPKEVKTPEQHLSIVSDLSKKEIVEENFKANKKHYFLHLKGCSVSEIHELTQKPIPSIKRDIWRYVTGKTVL